MNIELLRYPTEEDWWGAKQRTLVTVGKEPKNAPTMEWKKGLLRAKHSPIRYLQFSFLITDLPYWVSVHLCRHVHAQPYVRTSRNDRQNDFDRNAARQDTPINMIWDMNAEELITICEKRLCKQAARETTEVAMLMRDLVVERCPEFKDVLKPVCAKHAYCDEMFPCEFGKYLNGLRKQFVPNGGRE